MKATKIQPNHGHVITPLLVEAARVKKEVIAPNTAQPTEP